MYSNNPLAARRKYFIHAGIIAGTLTLFASMAAAQSVEFKANAPGLVLNSPESGAFGLQIKKLLRENPQALAPRAALAPGTPSIDPRKSIFVTDVNIMQKLTFTEVMDQLARQGGDPKTDKLALFRQWWDSAAKAPGTVTGPHCADKLNGFPYICPREEAAEATRDPFTNPGGSQGYSAIAYSNRLDLADPASPKDCGEYRVIFARNSGKTEDTNRNLIIFEARLKNPAPASGLEGCRGIQEFWRDLSTVSQDERGNRLKDFYLNGIPSKNIGPVIHIDNYAPATGQIRTNQFLDQAGKFVWTLREFKIQALQPGLRIVPVTVKTNPDPSLFSGKAPIDLQARFLTRLSDQFENLRGNGDEDSSSAFGLRLSQAADDDFNPFEGNEADATLGSLTEVFKTQSLVGSFIEAKLKDLGAATKLTSVNVVERIQTQTCAGCHQFSNGHDLGPGANNKWPNSLRFTHQSERNADLENIPEGGGQRYKISDTLTSNGFIPLRCVVMAKILDADPSPCGFTP